MDNIADLEIRMPVTEEEIDACSLLMSRTDPWLTLGRTYDESRKLFTDPQKEVFIAVESNRLAGFLVLDLNGPFKGYIQSLCIVPSRRSAGLGSKMIKFAENLIFEISPNAFICVSDFNPRAKALYQRLGYKAVGELPDFFVSGKTEILMRKTTGPIQSFRPRSKRAGFKGPGNTRGMHMEC
ncbi:MAG: GNAT family N-acetyltransferase [Thermovirgaceae bacterium]